MNDQGDDLVRLITSSDVTDLERRLLRSWNDERPTPAARAHTLAVLGLGTAAGVGAAAGVSIAPKALTAGWLAVAKWTAIAAVALTAGGVGTYAWTHRSTAIQSPSLPPQTTVAVAPPVVPVERAQPNPQTIELADTRHPPAGHATPAASSLAQQISALDRARAALDSGDAARARRMVDAYEAEWPAGAFGQEAEVVRIEALVRDGNRSEADHVAKRFLAAYPKSPHASRVRALMGYDP